MRWTVHLLLFVVTALTGAVVASCSSRGLVRQDARAVLRLPHRQWLDEAAQPSDAVIALAARDLQAYHNWRRSPPESLSQVEEAICYEGRLGSTVVQGTLHVFSYCAMQPTPHTLVVDYGDSLGTLHDAAGPGGGAIRPGLIQRLAPLLQVEPGNERQALEAALFIVNAQDVLSSRTLRVLKTWRGITHSRAYPVPDAIRQIVREPVVHRRGASLQVELYVWHLTSTALTRVTLTFEGEAVQYRIDELGRHGHPSVLL